MRKSVLFFSLMSIFGFSQQKSLVINHLKPKSERFVFPLISYKAKPAVEKKVNTFLQVNDLEYIPGTTGNPSQQVVSGKNTSSNTVYYYKWKKLDAPKNILSIKLEGEATGAYSENFTDYRNFDLRTGNYINIKDLFQPESLDSVRIMVNKSVAEKIENHIAELKSEEISDDSKEAVRMYQECLEYVNRGSLEYLKFFFGKEKLVFVRERCSNHAMSALDDLGDYQIDIPYYRMENHWSTFAKNLLSKNDKAVNNNSVQNRLYKGFIDGKYPITVLMKNIFADGSFSAFYWYDKTKKLIEWNGTLKDNHISATENDYYSEEMKMWIPRAFVEAEVRGKKISGTWQDNRTKKYLKLELEEL